MSDIDNDAREYDDATKKARFTCTVEVTRQQSESANVEGVGMSVIAIAPTVDKLEAALIDEFRAYLLADIIDAVFCFPTSGNFIKHETARARPLVDGWKAVNPMQRKNPS